MSIKVTRSNVTDLDASAYRTLVSWRAATIADTAGATTRVLTLNPTANLAPSTDASANAVFYLDPADYASTGRTLKYRVRACIITNPTAPAATFTFGLYPISSVSGGADTSTLTLGTVTSNSTAAIATPALNTTTTAVSVDFTAPSAGFFALGFVQDLQITADSRVTALACLQARNV